MILTMLIRIGNECSLRKIFQKFCTIEKKQIFMNISRQNAAKVPKIQLTSRFLENLDTKINQFDNSSLLKQSQCPENKIQELINSITNENSHLKVDNQMKNIDLKFCDFINELSPGEIFQCLKILLKFNLGEITNTNFYTKAIEILKIKLKREQLSKNDIFKLLIFAGLKKKKGAHNVKFIIACLPPFSQLSLLEVSILADTLFKCSIRVSKIQGKIIEDIITDNAELLMQEQYYLVSLCKAVRYIGPSRGFDAKNLTQALINAREKFKMPVCAHVVNLYSEAYLKDSNVLSRLFGDAFNNLSEENFRKIRVKDIDRLLWSARILNYQLSDDQMGKIEKYINREFKILTKENVHLMNILLSLWMFGRQLNSIIEECVNKGIFESITEDKSQWKHLARLQLLVTCIRLESPEIKIPETLMRPFSVGFKVQKNLNTTFNYLETMKNDLHIDKLEINCPIAGIYIPGISAIHNSQNVHIDVLDEYTCLKNSLEPHGLMNLKFRLLAKTSYKSIPVTQDCINNQEILKNHLSKILT